MGRRFGHRRITSFYYSQKTPSISSLGANPYNNTWWASIWWKTHLWRQTWQTYTGNVGIIMNYHNQIMLVLNFVSMLKMYELCLMDYDFMILNSPFLVHHPGIKSRKMGNKSENKSMVDAQNLFIYKQVMPELNFLHGKRKECHL